MLATYKFTVLNAVELREAWPVQNKDSTLSFDLEDGRLRAVSVTIKADAASFLPEVTPNPSPNVAANIRYRDHLLHAQAVELVLSWQANVVSFLPVSLDTDYPKISYKLEKGEDEDSFGVFGFSLDEPPAFTADFEQVAKAFLIGPRPDATVHARSFFRDGRIATRASRFVDAYLSYYLYLETLFCDGKFGNDRQARLLAEIGFLNSKLDEVCESLKDKISTDPRLSKVFEKSLSYKDRYLELVKLRGQLRHHSSKSTRKWDPNKQREFEPASRFLGALVGELILSESVDELYDAEILKRFRQAAEKVGATRKVLNKCICLDDQSLNCTISLPTSILPPRGISNCFQQIVCSKQRDLNLDALVRIDAEETAFGLKAYEARLGPWAYTQTRSLTLDRDKPISAKFDVLEGKDRFENHSVNIDQWVDGDVITNRKAWNLLCMTISHIERVRPPAEILRIEVIYPTIREPLASYYLGAGVRFN